MRKKQKAMKNLILIFVCVPKFKRNNIFKKGK